MWVYEHSSWPNFSYDSEKLTSSLAEVRFKQGSLYGKVHSLGFELEQEATLQMLTSDALKTSAIEGENLNTQEVRSSIARRLNIETAGLIASSRSVNGLVEVMIDATQNYNNKLTKERLLAWHAGLFPTGYSGMQKITIGDWRDDSSGAMQVISGPIGKRAVHFQAPPANTLNPEMDTFLNWLNATQETLDPVLKAGIAHFWFVTIHPFDDGNGRIARVIGDMLLAQSEQSQNRFYSLSSQIASERNKYYDILERQQKNDTDLTEWLLWFLDCMKHALEKAELLLERIIYKANFWRNANTFSINERQQRILNRMLEDDFEGFMNTSKYAKLAKCSNDTALRDIQTLKKHELLIQNPSKGRSTSYRLPD